MNAPANRTVEHCRHWVQAGHQVTVVTCVPNFPRGKVFDGYRNRLWQSETIDGMRVIRVWSYITANEGVLRRTLDYLSYMASAIAAAPFVRTPDVVVATSPQFFAACAGHVVARLKRVPFVFELRDLWPESIRAVGAIRQRRLLDWLEKVELFLYRRADLIVSVTHAFRDNLMARGIDPAKITVVTNGVDASLFRPQPKDAELSVALGLTGRFVAGYIGTHGMAHALGTVLNAAERLKATPDGDAFRLLLIGDGAEKAELKREAEARRLDNVIFIDTVPRSEIARYWSLLDASIIHLKKTTLFESVIPSKLFESMAMGVPVLHGVPGESARIVESEGAGIVFASEDDGALARALMDLRADVGLRAEFAVNGPAAVARYDRQVLAGKMLSQIAAAVALRGAPQAAPMPMRRMPPG